MLSRAFADIRHIRHAPWLFLAALYVLSGPNFDFAPELSWHDTQRLAQVALLVLFATVLLLSAGGAPVFRFWPLLPRWTRFAMAVALVLGLVSSSLAAYPRWALLEWAHLVLIGVFALAVAGECQVTNARRDQMLIAVFYGYAAISVIKAVVVYITMLAVGADYNLAFNVEELFNGFSNIRFFGHIQTMLLPFLLLPAMWWGRTVRERGALLMVPALWWMLVIASGTRGSWIALLIGAVAAVAMGGQSGRTWLRWQVGTLAAGAFFYLVFIMQVPKWFARPVVLMHRGADLISLRGRDIIWQHCFDLIAQFPWFGVGPMHFADRVTDLAAHPHNAVLQFMVEWGIPAALMITAVFVAGGLAWWRHVRRLTSTPEPDGQSMIAVSLLVAITGAAAQAMVDGIAVMPVSQILLVLLCGWALGRHYSTGTVVVAAIPGSVWLFRGLVLIALACILSGVAPDAGRLAERERDHLLKHLAGPNPRVLPRFWIQGWIGD